MMIDRDEAARQAVVAYGQKPWWQGCRVDEDRGQIVFMVKPRWPKDYVQPLKFCGYEVIIESAT